MANSSESLITEKFLGTKHKILLIDDKLSDAENLRNKLASEKDFLIHYCQDTNIAVKMIANIKPTLILLDLKMPQIDSFLLIKNIKSNKEFSDIPVIAISEKDDPILRKNSYISGAEGFIAKSFELNELKKITRFYSQYFINNLDNNGHKINLDKLLESSRNDRIRVSNFLSKLLPEKINDKQVKIDWRHYPAMNTGGDNFSYQYLDDKNISFCLVEVCGEGYLSSIMALTIINEIKSKSLPDTNYYSPQSVLNCLNKNFSFDEFNELYFTIWYGVYNFETKILNFSSAGHPPALMTENANPKIQKLLTENSIIGAVPGYQNKSDQVTINTPAKLFIYSDGVYKIPKPDGSMWDLDNFVEYMEFVSVKYDNELDRLYSHVKDLSGKETFNDDFTILKIEIL